MAYGDSRDRYDTALHIYDATRELLREKPYPELAVKDICERARVSRPTFYRYFEDKDGIAIWRMADLHEQTNWRIGDDLTWTEANAQLYETIRGESDFFSQFVAQDAGYRSLIAYGKRATHRCLLHIVKDRLGVEPDFELDFQMRAYAQVAVESAAEWMRRGMPESPAEMAAALDTCVPLRLHDLLLQELS